MHKPDIGKAKTNGMSEHPAQKWPKLDFETLQDTIASLHMWVQIIGKVRLKQMPWINHSWQVTLYISPTGLTTGSMPYSGGVFQIDLDLVSHQLMIITSAGKSLGFPLAGKSISAFYQALMDHLKTAGVNVEIYPVPNEVDPAIPFAENHTPCKYNGAVSHNFWQALVRIHNVFTEFRAGFSGKNSPVHFFWGGFDLAVTRFSGRLAPKHQGGVPNMPVAVMQEAYSHEVSSCGFWPGTAAYPHPSFYAYCYPTPANFGQQPVQPNEAFYNQELGEFILPYKVIQQAPNPEKTLLKFLQTTYDAAASTGHWDAALQCDLSALKNT